jgi:ketosteroid isomerase-like protein
MTTQQTREVVRDYFTHLSTGNLPAALSALSANVEFELPRDRWNQIIPYLGRHIGIEAVEEAFRIRAETTEILDYAMRQLNADGDTAFAVIYTKAAHRRTREIFEIEDAKAAVSE